MRQEFVIRTYVLDYVKNGWEALDDDASRSIHLHHSLSWHRRTLSEHFDVCSCILRTHDNTQCSRC